MGTNYYLHEKGEHDPCSTCGHVKDAPEPLHIGKSSAGWCFSLHVEPNDPEHPQTLAEWQERWSKPEARIVDEYSASIDPDEMLSIITKRSWPKQETPLGYRSWAEFHAANHSTAGPAGLLRHTYMCVAHGEGTWDLISGEFS